MQKIDFENALAKIKSANANAKSAFGIKVVTTTSYDSHMNKGGRKGVAVNPFYGRVTVVTTYTNIYVGTNYTNIVNAERAKEGMATDFVAQSLKGKQHVADSVLLESTSNKGTFYLPLMFRCDKDIMLADGTIESKPQTTTSKVYYLDGKVIEHEDLINLIATWHKEDKQLGSATQGTRKPIIYLAPCLANVLSVAL